MTYSRGDVVLVPFPFTDNSSYRQRPALVVQSDLLVTDYPQRVMAQITSAPRVGASRVQVTGASAEGQAMGLRGDSSLVLDKLVTLDDTEVIKVIGKCPPQTMLLVENALRATFDL